MEGVCSKPKFFPKRVIYWYSLHVFWHAVKSDDYEVSYVPPECPWQKKSCSDVFRVMNESSTSLFDAHACLPTPCGEAAECSHLSSLHQGFIDVYLKTSAQTNQVDIF